MTDALETLWGNWILFFKWKWLRYKNFCCAFSGAGDSVKMLWNSSTSPRSFLIECWVDMRPGNAHPSLKTRPLFFIV